MRISQKAEYAVRAVLDLAMHAPANAGVCSAEVARRTGIPKKFLDAILLDLRKGGVVSSKRGRDGGHWLARDPSRLTVDAIREAIDGPLSGPARNSRRGITPADECLRTLWEQVAASVHAVVDNLTLEDLRRQASPPSAVAFTI